MDTTLFTAATKVGIMELNRPEDIEWNANDKSGTPRLYVAFTNHGRKTALDQDGKMFDPSKHDADSKGIPNNRVLVSICHAFGIDQKRFGHSADPGVTTGRLEELHA